jgi:serine/threonine-protein kinase HipA
LGWQQGVICLTAVLLNFARVCDMACPEEVICEQLQALERVLARSTELGKQAPHVFAVIRLCAEPFIRVYG